MTEPLTVAEIAALDRYAQLNPDEFVAGDRTLSLARICRTLAAGVHLGDEGREEAEPR